jgi:hypothetical protein
VQHAGGQASQAVQGFGLVKIADKWGDATCAQFSHALRAGRQSQHAHTGGQLTRHAHTHIATTDDKHPLSAKAGGQRAQGVLV